MPMFQPAEKTNVCTEHYLPDNSTYSATVLLLRMLCTRAVTLREA